MVKPPFSNSSTSLLLSDKGIISLYPDVIENSHSLGTLVPNIGYPIIKSTYSDYINAALYAGQHIQCNHEETLSKRGQRLMALGVTLEILPSIQGSIYYPT